jgi:hypothetical protein
MLLDPITSGGLEGPPASVDDPHLTRPGQQGFVITRCKIMQRLLLENFLTHSVQAEIKHAPLTLWTAYIAWLCGCRRESNKPVVVR